MGDIDFEEQLELEKLERERRQRLDPDNHPREKVDPDGTVYEWDIEKKAWFPKIDDNFIAQYQATYGAEETKEETTEAAESDDKQQQFMQNYYYATVQEEQFMARKQKEVQHEDTHDEAVEKLSKLENDIKEGVLDDTQTDSKETMENYTEEQKQQYNEYWSYYYGTEHYDYYTECMKAYSAEAEKEKNAEAAKETKDGKKKKKGAKRKSEAPVREEGWFQVDEKDNTNVYVSNLPLDITLEEYTEMMIKYGLVMNDPRSKKPKLKLYMDEEGRPKGDGRCCFIKRESVDLALNLLDGMELRGKVIKVELASFNMKGTFDPTKKKKKLTNKEKRRAKERQQKLFDWRPDLPRFARAKNEKVVILKNVFDPKDFETDPLKINSVRIDVRTECCKYGDVKKTVVYDRHEDGVVSVHFAEAEEADLCIESLNQRYFAQRRIMAAQWDGNTKYEVVETEEERSKRLKQWEDFLEAGGQEGETDKPAAVTDTSGKSDVGESGVKGDKVADVEESGTKAEGGNDVVDIGVKGDKSVDAEDSGTKGDGGDDIEGVKGDAEEQVTKDESTVMEVTADAK